MLDIATPELLTLDEVARMLRVNRKTLLNWRARGVAPQGFRAGRAVLFRREAVTDYLAEQERLEQERSA